MDCDLNRNKNASIDHYFIKALEEEETPTTLIQKKKKGKDAQCQYVTQLLLEASAVVNEEVSRDASVVYAERVHKKCQLVVEREGQKVSFSSFKNSKPSF